MRTTYKSNKKMKIVSIFCYREQIPHEMCPGGSKSPPWEQNPAILCPGGSKFSPREQKCTEMCPPAPEWARWSVFLCLSGIFSSCREQTPPFCARVAANSLRGNKNALKCAPEGTFSSPRHRCNNFYYLCELWQHNTE